MEESQYPGFEKFIKEGVHTEYIKSVFPSESFPSWQTINTGLFNTPLSQYCVYSLEMRHILSFQMGW